MSEMDLTSEEVSELLRLLESASFDDLYLRRAGFELTLRRTSEGGTGPVAKPPTPGPAPVESAPPPSAPVPVPAQPDGGVPIPAPMVGTFYRRPEPGAEPYVAVGSSVAEDTTVGLIETMKLFTVVRAGVRGRITRVVAEDGQFVEDGTPLFAVEPA